jgi:hypothetical protein
MDPPSEIDKAVDLLAALKSARPAAFEAAMARLALAPRGGDAEQPAHASSLALGLLKGPFGRASSAMLLDLAGSLPRLPTGALGLAARPGAEPSSLAVAALRSHRLADPWTRFVAESIRDGLMPFDPDAAVELACQVFLEDPEDPDLSFGPPERFHATLAAFFAWPCDWKALSEQAHFDFVPWILRHWLDEGGPECFSSAAKACRILMAADAAPGLGPRRWLAFCSPPHPSAEAEGLAAMAECLAPLLPQIAASGESPCSTLCRLATPGPSMLPALRKVAELDPGGPLHVDAEGLSCLYWLNERLGEHDGSEWQLPLLACFDALVELGADPRSIAPQRPLSSVAKHPRVAAAVEAADLGSALAAPSPHPVGCSKSL